MEAEGRKHQPIDYEAAFKDPTVIILVGYPGSGKSSFTDELKALLPDNVVGRAGIEVVSNDVLGSLAKSLSTLKKLVSSPTSERPHLIVIDNTNPSIHTRQQYMDVVSASESKYKFVGIHVDTPKEYAMLFNWYRAWVQFRDGLRTMKCEDGVVNGAPHIPEYKHVPEIAYNVYKSKYEPLALDQGYDAIYEYTPPVENPCYKYTHAFMK